MANDIQAIDNAKAVNTINMVLSTTKTGFSSKRSSWNIVSADRQIENIQNKYTDRFDEIAYYYTGSLTAPNN